MIMDKLSPRQRQVTELLCEGYTHRGVANKLGISPNTVRDYVNTARLRAGCETTYQLIAVVVKEQSTK